MRDKQRKDKQKRKGEIRVEGEKSESKNKRIGGRQRKKEESCLSWAQLFGGKNESPACARGIKSNRALLLAGMFCLQPIVAVLIFQNCAVSNRNFHLCNSFPAVLPHYSFSFAPPLYGRRPCYSFHSFPTHNVSSFPVFFSTCYFNNKQHCITQTRLVRALVIARQ